MCEFEVNKTHIQIIALNGSPELTTGFAGFKLNCNIFLTEFGVEPDKS